MTGSYIDVLAGLGLSVNEAKVYLALLDRNTSAVNEIVSSSGVPQKMIYYTLQKLLEKGLCSLIPGKIKRYRPADPDMAIGGFIERSRAHIATSQTMLLKLQKQYETGQNETDADECLEILKNNALISDKMLSLEKAASREVLSFNKAPYAMSSRNTEELSGLKRGVVYRSIYEIIEASKLVSRSVIEMYHEAGEQVRVIQTLPMKMMLFDDKAVMFELRKEIPSTCDLSIAILRRSHLIKGLRELFDVYWEKAITLEEFKKNHPDSISLEDKA